MDDEAPAPAILVELRDVLEQSRQQQTRLRDALTRVLRLMEETESPSSSTTSR
jgi:hypothetical protein